MGVEVLTNTVAPLLGTTICVAMYVSPVRAVMKARRTLKLGSLNPIPFGLALINAISWCVFGIILGDYYIFIANAPGVVCGLFCVTSSLVIMGQNKGDFGDFNYRVVENILLGGVTFFLALGMVIGITLVNYDKEIRDVVVALVANSACVLYYGAPCSTMYEVIVSKNSSSLHLPMIFMNFLNSILWTVYAYFALHDFFVVVPNLIGASLAALQLSLICIYRDNSQNKQYLEVLCDDVSSVE